MRPIREKTVLEARVQYNEHSDTDAAAISPLPDLGCVLDGMHGMPWTSGAVRPNHPRCVFCSLPLGTAAAWGISDSSLYVTTRHR